MKTLSVSGWRIALFYLAHDAAYDELRKQIEAEIEGKDATDRIDIDVDIDDALNEAILLVWQGWATRKPKRKVIEEHRNAIRAR